MALREIVCVSEGSYIVVLAEWWVLGARPRASEDPTVR